MSDEPASIDEAPATPSSESETLLESLASICGVLIIGLFVMTFVFQNFEIPSASMVGTLLIGDHVVVDRVTLAPPTPWAFFMGYRDVHRGDVIVFLKPGEPDLYLVKRAIAIPGDRIHLHKGIVYLNGVAQNESQAGKPADDDNPQHAFNAYRDNFPSTKPGPYEEVTEQWAAELPRNVQDGDLLVPPGKIFALGDNRTESLDGRYWGFVPRENIVGRPLFVYWSFQTPADQIDKQSAGDRISFIGHVLFHMFDQTRWNRTLHRIL
ncbi:signal peptidase I [Granulicella arctica]|uniref:signal peptidase I n=1 Tax=Granulicella arctica TaxID=940613 RepID=UPI0021E02407|nr:signal peptidase I [Granulicella arctica]